ncbi:MAG: glycosyltransferase family 4 protein [Candidatus Lokiarchaeota archaeon]|nr:glycosyltransferase family 4 protein [Candidatus Lokiarchaeota archaeon]
MKICFLAPGEIEIPPNGWGALETVLWNQYNSLKKLGHDVYFINDKNTNSTYKKILEIDPDVVHLHYGKHWEIMPDLKCKKIVTSHDGSFLNSKPFHEQLVRKFYYDCTFFCLTSFEREFFLMLGISPNKAFILPNGVDYNKFNRVPKENAKHKGSSICLGKIDSRKRQSILQKQTSSVMFAGACEDPSFDTNSYSYLGVWDRVDVYSQLTHYSNLVLLSNTELQPLVCLEALAAGLGLVISEACVENLDTSKDFINVIPNNKINNIDYIEKVIKTNAEISLNSREDIYKYAQTFDWLNIAKKWLELNNK